MSDAIYYPSVDPDSPFASTVNRRDAHVVWQGHVDSLYTCTFRVVYSKERGYRIQELFAGELSGETVWDDVDLIERNAWGMVLSTVLREQRGEPAPKRGEPRLERKIR